MNELTIREFTTDDYQAVVDIQNAIFADRPAMIEDYIEFDQPLQNDPRCR